VPGRYPHKSLELQELNQGSRAQVALGAARSFDCVECLLCRGRAARTRIRMNAVVIPSHELKPNTWYYGIRCGCARLLALAEDAFAGRGDDHHPSDVALLVQCECGAVTSTKVLSKFKTP